MIGTEASKMSKQVAQEALVTIKVRLLPGNKIAVEKPGDTADDYIKAINLLGAAIQLLSGQFYKVSHQEQSRIIAPPPGMKVS